MCGLVRVYRLPLTVYRMATSERRTVDDERIAHTRAKLVPYRAGRDFYGNVRNSSDFSVFAARSKHTILQTKNRAQTFVSESRFRRFRRFVGSWVQVSVQRDVDARAG